MTRPVAPPRGQPRLARADTAGSMAIAINNEMASSNMKLRFWLKIQNPIVAMATKMINVRNTHLIPALSKLLALTGLSGKLFI